MIIIKNENQIDGIRKSCQLASATMKHVGLHVNAGITTDELNSIVHDYIVSKGGTPATLNYQGFPKSCCISVNEEICHGIPDSRKLVEGDLVKIDIATKLNGYFGDMCKTFAIGDVSLEAKKLMVSTQNALFGAIDLVKPNAFVGDIGQFIGDFAKSLGYGVVMEFCGHGVGVKFHESPQVHHVGKTGTGAKLSEGMTFTIEPMLCVGNPKMLLLENKWTAVTVDKSLVAQYEHTILVTKKGHEILTEF